MVRAGAGFGKSTLLAQAVRANASEPRGIDVWHTCTPGDVDRDVLGQALLDVLGRRWPVPRSGRAGRGHAREPTRRSTSASFSTTSTRSAPARRAASWSIASYEPFPTTGTSCSPLATRSPCGCHDFERRTAWSRSRSRTCCSRRPRRRPWRGGSARNPAPPSSWAAGRRSCASRSQSRPRSRSTSRRRKCSATSRMISGARCSPCRTSVTRTANASLASSASRSTSLRSPVRCRSCPTPRTACSGPMTCGRKRSCGCCHRMKWRTSGRVLVAELVASGDLARAGALALEHEDVDALARIAVEVVRRDVAAIPIDMVRPWNDVLQRARPDATRDATPERRAPPSAGLHRPRRRCRRRRRGRRASVTATTPTARSSRSSSERSVRTCGATSADSSISPGRAETIPGSARPPDDRSGAAIHRRDRCRDDRRRRTGARRAARRAAGSGCTVDQSFDQPSSRPLPVAQRARRRGGGGDAAAAGRSPRIAPPATCGRSPAGWSGEPRELLALGRASVDFPAVTSRDEFVRRTLVASMLASTGRRDEVHRLVEGAPSPVRDRSTPATPSSRRWPRRCAPSSITTRRPPRRLIADVIAAHAGSPILDQHLRRFLALALRARRRHPQAVGRRRDGPDARADPDAAAAGWSTCAPVARPTTAGLDPAKVFTAFPLPWSVELATRLHAVHHPDGPRLAEWLVEPGPRAGACRASPPQPATGGRRPCRRRPARPPSGRADPAARDLGPRSADGGVRRRRPSPRPSCAAAASAPCSRCSSCTARSPATSPSICCGPTTTPPRGARNLRVTLTYLRQLLEPERPPGEASFHLRADANAITLHRVRPPRRRPVGAAAAAARRRPQPGTGRPRPHHRPARRRHGVVAGRAAHRSGLRVPARTTRSSGSACCSSTACSS